MYGSWDRVHGRFNCYFSFGLFFILLPPSDPKNQNFEKRKNLSGDIIILHMCTRNYDQMMYSSWDMVRDGCNYFSFWAIFCPFTLLTAQKIKIKKNRKKPGDIIILLMCTKNYNQMMYGSWDMAHDRCNCYFSIWAIFCPFTPLQPKKSKFWKNEKTAQDIIILHMCTKNYDQMMYISVPEIWYVTDVIIFHFGAFFALLLP